MPPAEPQNKDEALFIQLVLMFQAAAMQQMGKVENPITRKVERSLEQARFSIDMLEMIENRTKGSLSENEKKFLEHVLFELRVNYVDEVKKDEGEKQEAAPTAQEPEKQEPSSEAEKDGAQEEKSPPDQKAPEQ
jgi:hypothetical protein